MGQFVGSPAIGVVSAAVQPSDAELTAIAGLTTVANKLTYWTGSHTAALADFTAFGRSLVDDADAAAGRVTLGVDAAWTYKLLAGDFTESAATPADVPNLSFTPAASKLYLIEAFLVWNSDAVTTGLQYKFVSPASLGTGTVWSVQSLQVEAGVNTQVLRLGAFDALVGGTGQGSISTKHPAMGWAMVKTGAAPSGDIKIQAQSEVGASVVTIFAGSFLRYREIS